MDMPLVQVVMPCRDGLPHLREALDSLCAQSYPNWAFSFVDCGSSDGSAQVVEAVFGTEATSRAHMLKAPGSSAGEARNLALASSPSSSAAGAADSPLVAFLDADDCWHPHKLATQVQLLTSGDAGLVYSDCRVINEHGRGLGTLFGTRRPRRGWCFEPLLDGNFVPLSSILMKRELFESAGGFPTGFRVAQDYLMLLRASRLATFDFHGEPLADYRVRPGSLSADYRATYRENVRLLEGMIESLIDDAESGELSREAGSEPTHSRDPAAPVRRAQRRVLWRWWLRALVDPGRGSGGTRWGDPAREAMRLAQGAMGISAIRDLAAVVWGGIHGAQLRWRMMRVRSTRPIEANTTTVPGE